MNQLQEKIPSRVAEALRRSSVVLVVSPLTDDRFLRPLLADQRLSVERVEFTMASQQDRMEFDHLKQLTGWRMLPQVFVEGQFLGGIDELLQWLSEKRGTTVMGTRVSSVSRANLLGFAGLLPFAGGLLALAVMGIESSAGVWAAQALLAYGAIILSFIGAIHWGRGIEKGGVQSKGLMTLSVLPALIAWVALLIPLNHGLLLLITAFLGMWWFDRHAYRSLPWLRELRGRLTGGVVALLLVSWVAI
jgi:glutaredoxin